MEAQARVSSAGSPLVSLQGLTKSYSGATVLSGVTLDVPAGSIHALLGENGAGKSTLIKIIAGVVTPDAGRVVIGGNPVPASSPALARDAGISVVHQENGCIPGLSIAENVALGTPAPTRWGVIQRREQVRRAADILEDLGHALDPRRSADRLTPVDKTMIAVARAVSRNVRLLVLDEPTASLTDRETTALFAVVARLAARGVSVLYVSHRLEEIHDVCDTWTVLRNGEQVGSGTIGEVRIPDLIRLMAGRPIGSVYPQRDNSIGEVMMTATGVSGRTVRDLDVSLHAGEVVGFAGLAGAGRSESLRLLGAAQPVRHGEVRLRHAGRGWTALPRRLAAAQRAGVVLVPQERRSQALVPGSITENVNLATISRHAVARTVISNRRAAAHAEQAADAIGVRRRSMRQPIVHLSGGNQQKVVLARFLDLAPRVLLLDEPTRGVDAATKAEIYRLIGELAARGTAIALGSSDLHELRNICDRVVVMRAGRPVATLDAAEGAERMLAACYGHVA